MRTQIHAVVITASDACSRGEREDKSGELLVELLTAIGAHIVAKEILADDLEPLADKLREYADRPDVNLVVTTGGTGFGMRDNTPEATLKVIEKGAPRFFGIDAVFRQDVRPGRTGGPCATARARLRPGL